VSGGADDAALAFRGKPVRPLAFGTSGLRGLVEDITDLEAYINTRGFLAYLLEGGQIAAGSRVALGGDLRPSTARILEAVARAVVDADLQADYQGRLPTPALTLYGMTEGIASIMVTGSHIPFDRNGIKFNRPQGEVLKSDEQPILAAVAQVRRAEYQRAAEHSAFADDGALRGGEPALPAASDRAATDYCARYRDRFPDALRGLRIAFFAHSAVGRDLIPALLRDLGAAVQVFGRSERFIPIDTEALSAATLDAIDAQLQQLTAEFGPFDAVVSTDGDSDRPLLLAPDTTGRLRFVSGDLLGLLVAGYLRADRVCVPVSASDAIDRHLLPAGVAVTRTRIGSPWVIAAMAQAGGERCVGWEANGGFLTGTALRLESGVLTALPTRDAVLPLVVALHAARSAGRSLLEQLATLPGRFTAAGLLDAVDPLDSRQLLARYGTGDDRIRMLHFEGTGVRAEDTDGRPCAIDAALTETLLARRDELSAAFESASICSGGLRAIDALDGLRLYFGNGDIAHIRPSGNAPQLRVYAVADSAERAAAIVRAALAEPDGLLRRLLAAAAPGNRTAVANLSPP
jgi:phosphomannomutase